MPICVDTNDFVLVYWSTGIQVVLLSWCGLGIKELPIDDGSAMICHRDLRGRVHRCAGRHIDSAAAVSGSTYNLEHHGKRVSGALSVAGDYRRRTAVRRRHLPFLVHRVLAAISTTEKDCLKYTAAIDQMGLT